MTYLYGAVLGIVLFFLVKEAIAEGVKAALTSEAVDLLLSNAVSRGIELHRQDREDDSEN